MYKVIIKNSAKKDLKKLKQNYLRKNFEEIIQQLKENPFEDNQGFEKLFPPSEGKYSRRINVQHRVVYSVDTESRTVAIFSAWSHYE